MDKKIWNSNSLFVFHLSTSQLPLCVTFGRFPSMLCLNQQRNNQLLSYSLGLFSTAVSLWVTSLWVD